MIYEGLLVVKRNLNFILRVRASSLAAWPIALNALALIFAHEPSLLAARLSAFSFTLDSIVRPLHTRHPNFVLAKL